MKLVRVVILAAALAGISWSAAFADGAIAVGKPANVAKNGIAVGLSTDFSSIKAASADAMSQCKRGEVKASTRALCRVVKTFTKQCAAVAFDPLPATSGFGWGLGATKSKARAAALASCNQSADPGRKGACKVFGADCD
jgi:hypothetical protein